MPSVTGGEPIARIPVPSWAMPIIIALASLAVSGFVAYTDNDKELTARIAVVETKADSTEKRLERIENKLDRVIEALSDRRS